MPGPTLVGKLAAAVHEAFGGAGGGAYSHGAASLLGAVVEQDFAVGTRRIVGSVCTLTSPAGRQLLLCGVTESTERLGEDALGGGIVSGRIVGCAVPSHFRYDWSDFADELFGIACGAIAGDSRSRGELLLEIGADLGAPGQA